MESEPKPEKRGFGQRLMRIIFEDEEKPSTQQSSQVNKNPDSPTPAPVGNFVSPTPTSTPAPFISGSAVDKQLLDFLRSQVNKAAPGVFSQFQTLLDNLSSVLTDRALLFRAAFKAAETGHQMKKETLVAAFQARLQILESEKQKFEEGVEARRKEVVEGKEKQVNQVSIQIEEMSNQLLKAQELLKTLTNEITEQNQKIETKQREFQLAHAALEAELINDLNNITTHLK
ncbi:MAG: hypothetical protein Q7S33_02435 [Nanoarchaeota archaeon]|nr:hypothetical protein [Nanoarchaeota archaeon]